MPYRTGYPAPQTIVQGGQLRTDRQGVIDKAVARLLESRRTFCWWTNLPWQLECAGFACGRQFRAVRVTGRGLTVVPAGGSRTVEWIIPLEDINPADIQFGPAVADLAPAVNLVAGRPVSAIPALRGCRVGSTVHGTPAIASSATGPFHWRGCPASNAGH